MKKIFLSMIAAVALCFTASSCSDEVVLESTGMRVAEVTVKYADWEKDDDVNYIYCTVNWDELTEHVVYDGTVSVNVYEGNRQNPLPYVYPIEVVNDNGSTAIVGENLRFDLEVGSLTIIMQDLDGYKPQVTRETCPDMTFRIVATAPINYIIEQ